MTSAVDVSNNVTVDLYITCLHPYQIRHHPYRVMIAHYAMNKSHHHIVKVNTSHTVMLEMGLFVVVSKSLSLAKMLLQHNANMEARNEVRHD